LSEDNRDFIHAHGCRLCPTRGIDDDDDDNDDLVNSAVPDTEITHSHTHIDIYVYNIYLNLYANIKCMMEYYYAYRQSNYYPLPR